MRELPKIISVDDHVVEPAPRVANIAAGTVPRERAARGPREVGAVHPQAGCTLREHHRLGRDRGDAWLDEDRLIYIQKSFVAVPQSATPGGIAGDSTAPRC